MMGFTHIVAGVAASFAALDPRGVAPCLMALAGGAVGGVISDLDVRSTRLCRDALYARAAVAALVIVSLLADRITGSGVWRALFGNAGLTQLLALAAFIALSVWGAFTRHRTFLHSLTAFALLSGALYLALPPLAPGFALGFLSHIALDLTNKKSIRLFYPLRRGFCLRLFRADGLVNGLLLVLFAFIDAVMIYVRLF